MSQASFIVEDSFMPSLVLVYSTTQIQHFIESRRVLIEMDSYFHELSFLFAYLQNWPFISGVRDDSKTIIGMK